jgi:hypothetical protein
MLKAQDCAQRQEFVMVRGVIVGCLGFAIVASMAGFPFEPAEAYDWAGFFFVLFALALLVAALLLALDAGRSGNDLAATGFVLVGLYGLGTALNGSLMARGFPEISVGVQPGIWGMLAAGMLLIGLSARFPRWVSVAGIASAAGHAIALTAVTFGAEMPHTGATPSDLAPMIVAVSKLLFWVAIIGWILHVRQEPRSVAVESQTSTQVVRRPQMP